MSRAIGTHIRRNVVAYLSLFFALSGVAIALPGTNTVQSNDIGPGEQVKNGDTKPVRGTWVANDSLRGADVDESSLGTVPSATTAAGVANNAIDSASVDNNSLTGADIDESSLGIVPNANELDGLDSTQLSPATGDGRTADLALTTVPATVLSANITTARPAALLVSAAVDVIGSGGGFVLCRLQFDGGASSVPYGHNNIAHATIPVVWAQPVGAGAHTVALLCSAGAGGTVDNAGMIVSGHL